MKTEMNPSNDGFAIARNEQSPRFVSNGIHTKGDIEGMRRIRVLAKINLNKGRRRRDLAFKALSL